MSNYNGWTNYETWTINLWINGEEGSYKYWTAAARQAESTEALAEQLKDEHKAGAPNLQGA